MSKSHFLPSQGGAISGLLSGRHIEDHFVHFVGLLGCHLVSISGVNFGTIFRTLPTGELARGGDPPGGDMDLGRSGGARPETPNTKEISTDRPAERSLWRSNVKKPSVL